MADVECGKFELLKQAPAPGMLTFRAILNGAPGARWRAVFDEYQGMECAGSNPAVARIRGNVMEFSVSEPCAQAAAAAIRRCIEKTNLAVAKRVARETAVAAGAGEMLADEWKRVEDKYRDGL